MLFTVVHNSVSEVFCYSVDVGVGECWCVRAGQGPVDTACKGGPVCPVEVGVSALGGGGVRPGKGMFDRYGEMVGWELQEGFP